MRFSNIKFTALAKSENGNQKMRWFCSEEALSRWANRMYIKDNSVTVIVYNGNSVDDSNIYCTYHE